jgi:hypothetical protein
MQWLRTVRNGGKLYWKPKSPTDCSTREEEEEFFLENNGTACIYTVPSPEDGCSKDIRNVVNTAYI